MLIRHFKAIRTEDVIGTPTSHGCIRMSNPGIEKLVAVLPLGVPVEIKA